ncbi:MAG: hypothetical protein ACE5OZ_22040 [Candidatus Heimdallarchaeota archaeon]
MPEVPYPVGAEWHYSNDLPQKIIRYPSPTSMAIAERRVNRRSSRESPLATGAIGVRGSSAIRGYPGLRAEQAIKQVQPSVKREFPRNARLRGLAGSSDLQE